MVNRYQLRGRRMRRKAYKKTKYGAAKMKRFRRRAGYQGSLFVRRKAKAIVSSGSGVLGGYTITGAQNAIALGTPVSVPGTNGLYDIPFSVVARLDDMVNYTELTALFDQYKITGVKVQVQGWNASNAPGTPLPFLQVDRDTDSANLVTPTAFRERMGIQTKYISASRPAVSMYFKPRVAQEVFATGVTTGYAIPRGPVWLNTLNPNIEHYCAVGILRNVYIPAQASVSTLTWEVTYSVSCRDLQ